MDIHRFIKPVILALIMFFSMRFLGFPLFAAFMFSLIPFALGSLNVMTRLAYSMTAIALIIAAISTVVKREDLEGVKNTIRNFIEKGH